MLGECVIFTARCAWLWDHERAHVTWQVMNSEIAKCANGVEASFNNFSSKEDFSDDSSESSQNSTPELQAQTKGFLHLLKLGDTLLSSCPSPKRFAGRVWHPPQHTASCGKVFTVLLTRPLSSQLFMRYGCHGNSPSWFPIKWGNFHHLL